MVALTSDRSTEYSLGDLLSIPVAAGACIYAGAIVCVNEDGYAVPASDTPDLIVAGIATAQSNNCSGDDGDLSSVVRRRGRYRLDSTVLLDQRHLGVLVYAVDDHTVGFGPGIAHSVLVGIIDKVEGARECWVSIDAAVLAGRHVFRL